MVNPDGRLHRYARLGAMIELEPMHSPEMITPVDPLETLATDLILLGQRLREIGNPPELVMRQEEAAPVIEISGAFRAYGSQWYADARQAEPETFMNYDFTENPQRFRISGRSSLNPSLVLIEVRNPDRYDVYRHWINLGDLEGKFRIRDDELESLPLMYPLRSFVADETLDVELIGEDPTWRDKSRVGVLSRDMNPVGSTEEFQLQAPTIGPDVIVEFVDAVHHSLGNFVVISFPASVIQEDETIMQSLSGDPNHDPGKWRDDGRIFIAFAHLSLIESHIRPGVSLDSREKGIIGMTGSTGTSVNHLDLSFAYYGSMDDGTEQMRHALAAVRSNRESADFYFGLAARSNFVGRSTVYAENIDPVRVWPELDELQEAENPDEESIYPWKI